MLRHTLRYKHHDFDLAEGEFVVGRGVTCQLSLDDPMVSRTHARLRVLPEGVEIEDLGSRNGVRVNGERIERSRKLQHNDQITIGSQDMTIVVRRELMADTLVQSPDEQSGRFGVFGALAEKAL